MVRGWYPICHVLSRPEIAIQCIVILGSDTCLSRWYQSYAKYVQYLTSVTIAYLSLNYVFLVRMMIFRDNETS